MEDKFELTPLQHVRIDRKIKNAIRKVKLLMDICPGKTVVKKSSNKYKKPFTQK